MKPSTYIPGLTVLTIAALTGTARLGAQEPAIAASAAEIRYEVQSSRTVPLPGGRNLIVQQVSPPVLPPAPPVIQRPPITPEQLAARRAVNPVPLETRLLCLSVTRYAENLSYIEWQPHGGGEPYGAWSNADYDALRMVPDVEISPGDVHWLIFPFVIYNPFLRPGPGPVSLPQLPADGPGFLVVKGNPADAQNVNPVAALHKIYREEGAALKAAWAERERQLREEEAWRAAQPPPGDAVIRFWIIETPEQPAANGAPTSDTSAK